MCHIIVLIAVQVKVFLLIFFYYSDILLYGVRGEASPVVNVIFRKTIFN